MKDLKTLLLNNSYEVLSFVSFQKTMKLFVKGKVEIISEWDEIITWTSGTIKHPSILRLKTHIKRNFFNFNFSRKSLVNRDHSSCQYCGQKLTASQITVDHILPRVNGGITSFTNCVISCHSCNNKKGDKTPELAGMVLLKKPIAPTIFSNYVSETQEHWFEGWNDYINC